MYLSEEETFWMLHQLLRGSKYNLAVSFIYVSHSRCMCFVVSTQKMSFSVQRSIIELLMKLLSCCVCVGLILSVCVCVNMYAQGLFLKGFPLLTEWNFILERLLGSFVRNFVTSTVSLPIHVFMGVLLSFL